MNFTHEHKIVQAFKLATNSFVPFYSVAQCDLGGCTLHFGSYERKKGVTDVIEERTGVRCFSASPFRPDVPENDRVQQLYDGVIRTMQKSPFDMGVAAYLFSVYGAGIPAEKRNFVEPWKISLISF